MKTLLKFLTILILVNLSCKKEEININPDKLLFGTWNSSGYQDNISIYARSNEFIDNHGYNFHKDGTLTERKNAGWCGTPPVTYADYDGTWTQVNDTLIEVNVAYWGGQITYRLDIESVNETYLKVIYLSESE